MKYNNPVVKGFYPDPSVCKVGDTFYMVCSTFQYFPGVPIFESKDLINWNQIGHCLTRPSQIQLDKITSSGGVFAPTIRYNNGRFYMTTTNDTTHQNFYIWTDNIYGEWSEPIYVEQSGIDPSLYFEEGRTYFMSNGEDDNGVGGIVQCEIEVETGRKLTPSKSIWNGTGGRFLESPHLYKINGKYYLMAAEGGTEYGHMVTYARGDNPFGPFEAYPLNPVLTNRNLGGFEIQGVGHADLIQDNEGNWWMLHLGFRQIDRWLTFHHLGREVFLVPVHFGEDGWFTAGENGTTVKCFEVASISDDIVQKEKKCYTFENTRWDIDWAYLRIPVRENYLFENNKLILKGSDISLDAVDSPTFIGLRQRDFDSVISCNVKLTDGEAGITIFMDENHHYDLAIRKAEGKYAVVLRLNIGNMKSIQKELDLNDSDNITLIIRSEHLNYSFSIMQEGKEIPLGTGLTRYLSSEVAGGFTGAMIGLYAYDETGSGQAEFTNFKCEYL